VLQYLCCEVAALQESGQLQQLRVCDVAAMAWRLQTACGVEEAMNTFEQVMTTFGSIRTPQKH
jgi:hypothetical protein